jgi:hypothetical protein
VDDTLRAEYRTAVRHWHETEELLYRRRVAYETYRDMYTAYSHALTEDEFKYNEGREKMR